MTNTTKARLIAYYLPQFHPIPENDENWGEGFTEWTNVKKAKPLFKGHYQPFIPTELGYYDLRDAKVRMAQAQLAKEHGIEGFCYWHYWFGNGKRLLELPFNEVVNSGEPDFPFCLCWANHSWTAIWVGDAKKVIIEQEYPGIEDYTNHFYELLPAFKDKRYINVDGKLVFSIFSPRMIPDCKLFVDVWRELAVKENLPGFHFIGMGVSEKQLATFGLDAWTEHSPHTVISQFPVKFLDKISYKFFGLNYAQTVGKILNRPTIYQYEDVLKQMLKTKFTPNEYPIVFPNWDHSPRSGKRAFVIHGSNPQLFGRILKHCIDSVIARSFDKRIVFIKAWNEWAEGNYLEPEKKFGRGFLEEVKRANNKASEV